MPPVPDVNLPAFLAETQVDVGPAMVGRCKVETYEALLLVEVADDTKVRLGLLDHPWG
jgi:hypothetical protein